MESENLNLKNQLTDLKSKEIFNIRLIEDYEKNFKDLKEKIHNLERKN